MIKIPLHGGGLMLVDETTSPPTFDLSAVTPRVISHGLARTNRFSGQTLHPFSDAEHSVLLARWVRALGYPNPMVRYALLHDATECLGFGDPHRYVKRLLGNGLRAAEQVLMDRLWEHMGGGGLGPWGKARVEQLDHLIGNWEAKQFKFPTNLDYPQFDGTRPVPGTVKFWYPPMAEYEWDAEWERASNACPLH